MKIKVFTFEKSVPTDIEKEINKWIEDENLTEKRILFVNQSESMNAKSRLNLTYSIIYAPSQKDQLKIANKE